MENEILKFNDEDSVPELPDFPDSDVSPDTEHPPIDIE
jgi:hypothetical protein